MDQQMEIKCLHDWKTKLEGTIAILKVAVLTCKDALIETRVRAGSREQTNQW